MEWLPAISVTVAPARSAIARCAGGGIIRSSVATRYQLGLMRQAGSVTAPSRAATPHGTCESAMKDACPAGRSPAKDAANLSRSRYRLPSRGGRIGGTGAPGGGSAMRVLTDSPLSGAKAVTYTSAETLGCVPTSVMTTPPYEWPTRTTSPSRASRTSRVASTSPSSDCVGFCTTLTRKPSAVRASYTPCQPEPSTNPPCTSTTLRTEPVLILLLLPGVLGDGRGRYEPPPEGS